MVKLPTTLPPGARISTLTVATPPASLACVESVTVPPSSTGSGVSAVPLKDGDVVSCTTTVPDAEAAFPEGSIAQTRYERVSIVVKACVASYAPLAALNVIVRFARRDPEAARTSTNTVATASLSATWAENKTLDPASTGWGVSVAPVTVGGARSTTTKDPAFDARFPAASEAQTVNAWVPTSAVVY